METVFVGADEAGNLQFMTLSPVDLNADGAFGAMSLKHGKGLAETILRTSSLAKALSCVIGTFMPEDFLLLTSFPVFPERYLEVVEQAIAPRTLGAGQPPQELKVVISVSEEVPADQAPGLEEGAIRCILKAVGNRFPLALYLTQAHGLTVLTREVNTEELVRILSDAKIPPSAANGGV